MTAPRPSLHNALLCSVVTELNILLSGVALITGCNTTVAIIPSLILIRFFLQCIVELVFLFGKNVEDLHWIMRSIIREVVGVSPCSNHVSVPVSKDLEKDSVQIQCVLVNRSGSSVRTSNGSCLRGRRAGGDVIIRHLAASVVLHAPVARGLKPGLGTPWEDVLYPYLPRHARAVTRPLQGHRHGSSEGLGKHCRARWRPRTIEQRKGERDARKADMHVVTVSPCIHCADLLCHRR
mmetsp:Transcript_61095/g.162261  ORF Transcript_61095/g.162261 Transcript_61095/m.162261 type:complete len:236 (+) Transcript_61095:421-1128(+)